MERIGEIIEIKKAPLIGKKEEGLVRLNLSRETLRRGFTQIPNIIILDPALDCQEKAILMVLYFHAMHKDHCFPSDKLIAQGAGCSIATVKRKRKSLKKKGYLDWERTGRFNTYFLKVRINHSSKY
jgi:AraC-like DNA-binding protein